MLTFANPAAFITSLLAPRTHVHERFWIGLREKENDEFQWVDNNELSYTNFMAKQPGITGVMLSMYIIILRIEFSFILFAEKMRIYFL